ncbi:ABC1 kinase family protein [Nocardiopsis lambiniae]|uniref:AarF/UbiB family protein n=1 Tax=Nocardiopsis lambiniae TaxID=3075539 RepID=A0ABU2M2M8_9ACTN|nr:AarF/UbiB family protein [Nocardiopsis sp. DSM 44743]MDT0326899.1 AarF/UbiB family protein [Nocardiopsis sp. DSM 44743]
MVYVGEGILQLFSLLLFVALLIGLGLLASRMMGVPFSLPRLVLSGLVGLFLGSAAAALLYYGSLERLAQEVPVTAPGPEYVSVTMLMSAAVALLAFVGLELAVPRGTRPRPVHAVRAVFDWFGRVRRYRQIMWILARRGLWGYVSGRKEDGEDTSTQRRLARSLARSLEEAGVVFVKLGQVLATRRDLLPPVFVEELGRLHSEVAPVPAERIRDAVERELGRPVDDVFTDFSDEPLAAASIAQAHTARLVDGEEVVVKVQRPGIAPLVHRDLDIIRRLAARFDEYTDWGPAIGVVDLAEGFAEALVEELDFEVEAANIAAVAEAAHDSPVRIPRVYDAYTSRGVLVMERLHGVSIGFVDPADVDGEEIARVLLNCLLEQVMISGIFHADPHPGNIMVLDEGGVGLLDYGSVGRLDGQTREALRLMLMALDRRDAVLLTDTLLDVVTDPEGVDGERLRRALGQFMARHLQAGMTASMRMFTELLLIVTRFGLTLPAELAAVFRALATLEGTLVHLSPGFDTVAEAKRFAGDRMSEQLRGEALRDLAADEIIALLPTLRRLPRRLDRITDQLHKGRFTVQVRPFAHPDDRRLIGDLAQRAILTVLAVATGLMSVGLFNVTDGPDVVWSQMSARAQLLNGAAWLLLVVAALLVLRLLVGVARDGVRRRP